MKKRSTSKTDEITQSIHERDLKILWGKAAGRCSICKKKLVHEASEQVPSRSIPVGQNCHIVADKRRGPRGKSILTSEERNRYSNLILLCADHHIVIDRDPINWPIEKLHQMKADHEIWVETQLTDVTADLETEVYSDLVNTATDLLMLPYWDWFSDSAFQFLLPEEFVDGARVFWTKAQRTIWPGRYPELEKALQNLSKKLSTYIKHFLDHGTLREDAKRRGKGFYVEDRAWKSEWRDGYDSLAKKSNKWQKQSRSLLSNVAAALNEYADAVRKYLNPRYLIFEGKFIVGDSLGLTREVKRTMGTPMTYSDIDMEKKNP